jgi:hypothetical protein
MRKKQMMKDSVRMITVVCLDREATTTPAKFFNPFHIPIKANVWVGLPHEIWLAI